MCQNHFSFAHSTSRLTIAEPHIFILSTYYTEYVQLNINRTDIYETLQCKWLEHLHWLVYWSSESESPRHSWLVWSSKFLDILSEKPFHRSPSKQSGPSSTGGKASAEWEVDFWVLVFSPGTKRHYYRSTVIFTTILYCLQGLAGRKKKTRQIRVCMKKHHRSSGGL